MIAIGLVQRDDASGGDRAGDRAGNRAGNRIANTPSANGLERLRADFTGRAYETHRHDTYTICVTDRGLQAFDYRGAARLSVPGEVVVLHPDEPHDGRAGSDAGFGYRGVYVAPFKIAEAARALCGAAVPLPFVREPVLASTGPVSASAILAKAVAGAFIGFPAALEPLAADALVESLARGLIEADPAIRGKRRRTAPDRRALERTREFLDAAKTRVVASGEIEAVGGLDRFALARQFRHAYGTSPYRYLLMRRLDWVRGEIRAGRALAAIALDAGFADQPHLSRMFKAAYGLSPAQFRSAAQTS